MDEKSPNADRFRGVPRPEKRVAQQQATKSHVLVTVIDGKTSQYGRRNRIGHVAPDAAGRFRYCDRARSEAEVADHDAAVTRYISP